MRRINEDVARLLERFGAKSPSRLPLGVTRPMTEEARQVLVNRLKRVREPHSDPILNPRELGVKVSENEDSISITIPKRPVERLTREQAVELLAVRRAGAKP